MLGAGAAVLGGAVSRFFGRSPGVLGLAAAAAVACSLFLAPACTEFIGCEKVRKCPGDGGMGGAPSGEGGEVTSGGDAGSDAGHLGGNADSVGGSASGGKPSASGGRDGSGGTDGTGANDGAGGAPPPPECADVTCQDNATCTVQGASPVCQCDSGFQPVGGACQDINECGGDPCGDNQVCENEPGSYVCSCASGFYEDLGECWPDMVLVSSISDAHGLSEETGSPSGCYNPGISGDGRHVGFVCENVDEFGLPDNGSGLQALSRDLRGGSVKLVSMGLNATPADAAAGYKVSLSDGGEVIAFESAATNLVPGDTNDSEDVFTRSSAGILRASVSSGGLQADGPSRNPSLSGDGQILVFESSATNLVLGDTNGAWDVFVHYRQTGETKRISLSSTGQQTGADCGDAQISRSGRYVTFQCDAALTPDDLNTYTDVYRHDLQTGQVQRVSVSAVAGQPGNGDSLTSAVSDDGRFVVFSSDASDLVAGDDNASWDVFVRDLEAGTTQRVSVSSAGIPGNSHSNLPAAVASSVDAISGDGRFVLFRSMATNLVPEFSGDPYPLAQHLFIRDLTSGTTRLITTGPDGQLANTGVFYASLSTDGRFAVFASNASNLGVQTGVHQVWLKRILP